MNDRLRSVFINSLLGIYIAYLLLLFFVRHETGHTLLHNVSITGSYLLAGIGFIVYYNSRSILGSVMLIVSLFVLTAGGLLYETTLFGEVHF